MWSTLLLLPMHAQLHSNPSFSSCQIQLEVRMPDTTRTKPNPNTLNNSTANNKTSSAPNLNPHKNCGCNCLLGHGCRNPVPVKGKWCERCRIVSNTPFTTFHSGTDGNRLAVKDTSQIALVFEESCDLLSRYLGYIGGETTENATKSLATTGPYRASVAVPLLAGQLQYSDTQR